MTPYLDPLIAFVSAHAWLAYLTIFLAALLEAVPVVGSVIPGSTIILALSALVPGGELRLELVLAAAITGAMLGDGTAFWVGHRSQREILRAWPMASYPRVVAQSEAFFRRCCACRACSGFGRLGIIQPMIPWPNKPDASNPAITLRLRIGRPSRPRLRARRQGGIGDDVDDRPTPLLAHRWQECLHAVIGSVHVRPDH